ncbi:MAG: hypothetical protein JXQ73_17460 [Phycisphaerae bacterium]|nr:hypothetical protein [Phycisphaerae bacterium]
MAQAIKTFTIVLVLTLLIWLYADQASSQTKSFMMWLSLRPPRSAEWRFADPNAERVPVEIQFSGPSRSMRELQEDVEDDRFRLTYVIEADPPSGPFRLVLADKLDTLEEIERRGLRVESVNPSELTIQVDRLVTKELPVVAKADSFKIVQTTVSPPTVKVVLPKSQIDTLAATEIVANVEALEAHRLQIREHLREAATNPGQAIELYDVPLIRPPGAVLKDERVFVKAVIERRDQTKALRSVYVRFDVSQDQWTKYDLEVKNNADLSIEVTVRGPSDVIASLTPQDVRAFVEINTSDAIKTEGWLTRTVIFVLPEGVILDQIAPQVQFRLVERQKSTAGYASKSYP